MLCFPHLVLVIPRPTVQHFKLQDFFQAIWSASVFGLPLKARSEKTNQTESMGLKWQQPRHQKWLELVNEQKEMNLLIKKCFVFPLHTAHWRKKDIKCVPFSPSPKLHRVPDVWSDTKTTYNFYALSQNCITYSEMYKYGCISFCHDWSKCFWKGNFEDCAH